MKLAGIIPIPIFVNNNGGGDPNILLAAYLVSNMVCVLLYIILIIRWNLNKRITKQTLWEAVTEDIGNFWMLNVFFIIINGLALFIFATLLVYNNL